MSDQSVWVFIERTNDRMNGYLEIDPRDFKVPYGEVLGMADDEPLSPHHHRVGSSVDMRSIDVTDITLPSSNSSKNDVTTASSTTAPTQPDSSSDDALGPSGGLLDDTPVNASAASGQVSMAMTTGSSSMSPISESSSLSLSATATVTSSIGAPSPTRSSPIVTVTAAAAAADDDGTSPTIPSSSTPSSSAIRVGDDGKGGALTLQLTSSTTSLLPNRLSSNSEEIPQCQLQHQWQHHHHHQVEMHHHTTRLSYHRHQMQPFRILRHQHQ
jgi:hypothetical protein